jgi:hypothetical protein
MIGFINKVAVADEGLNVLESYEAQSSMDNIFEWTMFFSNDLTVPDHRKSGKDGIHLSIGETLHMLNELKGDSEVHDGVRFVASASRLFQKTVQCALELRDSYDHVWEIIKSGGSGECT